MKAIIFQKTNENFTRNRNMRTGKGKTRDIVILICLIAGGVCLLVTQYRINFAKDRKLMESITCAAQLKQIGAALLEYAEKEGSFPQADGSAGLNQLKLQQIPEWQELFLCPAIKLQAEKGKHLEEGHCSYHYFGGAEFKRKGSRDILIIERAGNHKNFFNVLFADGTVSGIIPDAKPANLEAVLRESYQNDFSSSFRKRQLETARTLDRISFQAIQKKE